MTNSSSPDRFRKETGGESKAEGAAWPKLWEAWPLFLLVILLVYAGINVWPQPSVESMSDAAALVDRTSPKLPKWSKPPRGVEDVLKDLSRGDCWTASARLRGLRKSKDDSAELRLLEGASFVCAGNGRAAANAVDPLVALDFKGDATWIRANAALLMGSVDEARSLLHQIIERDTDWRRSAEALLIRIETL